MAFERNYRTDAPARADVDALPGATLLEFGTDWCGHCQAAAPLVQAALAARTDLRHLKVEDGRGRPLGRSFGVKLWPTLVLLHEGRELARAVRPRTAGDLDALLAAADPAPDLHGDGSR